MAASFGHMSFGPAPNDIHSHPSASSSTSQVRYHPANQDPYWNITTDPPPGHNSTKGTLTIHINSFIVLLHPPQPGELDAPHEDTVLTGSLEITMKEARMAKSIRVWVACWVALQVPGRGPQEKYIWERSIKIVGDESPDGGPSEGVRLEKGTQRFEFSLILPSTLATYDRHPFGKITHAVKAIVEGDEEVSNKAFSLFSGGKGKGKERERSASRPRSRGPSRGPSRQNLQDMVAEAELSPGLGRPMDIDTSPGVYSENKNPFDELKMLHGHLFNFRHLIVAANPNPPGAPVSTNMNYMKEGRLVGVGQWKLSLRSDAFLIGSYLHQDLLFLNPHPLATIFAVRLLLSQSYTVADLNNPTAAPFKAPKRNFLIFQDGVVPEGTKRPSPATPALWRGAMVGGRPDVGESEDFKLKSGRKRLPDDTKARPSTGAGTETPIRVYHEFMLHVYFSIWGEDLAGNPIVGIDQSGEIKAMTITIPVQIPSCCCTFERLALPEYSELPEPAGKDFAAYCACGYTVDELASREQELAGQEDGLDAVDMDSLTLDTRGRRGRETGRRKAEFEHIADQ